GLLDATDCSAAAADASAAADSSTTAAGPSATGAATGAATRPAAGAAAVDVLLLVIRHLGVVVVIGVGRQTQRLREERMRLGGSAQQLHHRRLEGLIGTRGLPSDERERRRIDVQSLGASLDARVGAR